MYFTWIINSQVLYVEKVNIAKNNPNGLRPDGGNKEKGFYLQKGAHGDEVEEVKRMRPDSIWTRFEELDSFDQMYKSCQKNIDRVEKLKTKHRVKNLADAIQERKERKKQRQKEIERKTNMPKGWYIVTLAYTVPDKGGGPVTRFKECKVLGNDQLDAEGKAIAMARSKAPASLFEVFSSEYIGVWTDQDEQKFQLAQ